jgi:ferrochelatase
MKGGVTALPEVIELVKKQYTAVGGKTPLNSITSQQAALLQVALDENYPGEYKVFVGMKFWEPSISDAVLQAINLGVQEIIGIALAPHYSKMSIGAYEKMLEDAVASLCLNIPMHFIQHWHLEPALIDCIAMQTREAIGEEKEGNDFRLIFTAHSLPEKIREWNDPYEKELQETAVLVAQKLGIKEWQFAFQSAGFTKDKWLGPDVRSVVKELIEQGVRQIVISPIGFACDNLEILYNIDIECSNIAQKNNIEMRRVESRNMHPLFIKALRNITVSQRSR